MAPRPGRPTVVVTELEEPIDVDAWVRDYVSLALECDRRRAEASSTRPDEGRRMGSSPVPVARSV